MKQRLFCCSIEIHCPYFAKILYRAGDLLPAGSPVLSFSGVQPFPVWTDVVLRSILIHLSEFFQKNYDFTQFYHFCMVK